MTCVEIARSNVRVIEWTRRVTDVFADQMAEHHSRTYCSGSHVYGQIAIIQSTVGIVLLNSVTLLNGLTRRNDRYRMVDLLSPKWVMEETLMADPHCSYTSRSRSAGTPKSPKNLGDLEMQQL